MFRKCIMAVLIFLNLWECNSAISCKFKNVVCDIYNKSQLEVRECRIRAVARNNNNLNLVIRPKETITHTIVSFLLLKRENGWKPFMYNVTLDGCKFMKNPKANPVANYFFSYFKDVSNINHTCPYDNDVFIKGLRITNDLIRLPFPMGLYGMDAIFRLNHSLTAKLHLACEIVKD